MLLSQVFFPADDDEGEKDGKDKLCEQIWAIVWGRKESLSQGTVTENPWASMAWYNAHKGILEIWSS